MAERLCETCAAGSFERTQVPKVLPHRHRIIRRDIDDIKAAGWQSQQSRNDGAHDRDFGYPLFANTNLNNA